MSIFTKIKNIFKRKKPVEELPPLEEIPELKKEVVSTSQEQQKVELSNVRAKLDLVLTELDNIKIQNQMMNERLKAMEKTLAEMRGIRYY